MAALVGRCVLARRASSASGGALLASRTTCRSGGGARRQRGAERPLRPTRQAPGRGGGGRRTPLTPLPGLGGLPRGRRSCCAGRPSAPPPRLPSPAHLIEGSGGHGFTYRRVGRARYAQVGHPPPSYPHLGIILWKIAARTARQPSTQPAAVVAAVRQASRRVQSSGHRERGLGIRPRRCGTRARRHGPRELAPGRSRTGRMRGCRRTPRPSAPARP